MLKFVISSTIIVSLCLFSLTSCDDGNDHVRQLFQAGDVCNAPQGSWVPLPDGAKCGDSDCKWPGQWCTINKGDASSTTMKCADVPAPCMQAMGVQPSPASPAPPPPPPSGQMDHQQGHGGGDSGCSDMHELCCFWAQNGECDNNIYFMRVACQKSCGTCGCSVDKADSCPVKVNAGNCKFSSNGGGGSSSGCNQQSGCGGGSQAVVQPQQGGGCGQGCQQPQPQPQPCGNGGGCGGGGQQPPANPCGGGCNQAPPCQQGIFPAAGGGCGAKQYGGRTGCGSGCGQGAAVMQPQPSRAVSHTASAGGFAQNPSLPSGGGCNDMLLSCKKISPNQCDQSSLVNNMCQKSCGCKRRR